MVKNPPTQLLDDKGADGSIPSDEPGKGPNEDPKPPAPKKSPKKKPPPRKRAPGADDEPPEQKPDGSPPESPKKQGHQGPKGRNKPLNGVPPGSPPPDRRQKSGTPPGSPKNIKRRAEETSSSATEFEGYVEQIRGGSKKACDDFRNFIIEHSNAEPYPMIRWAELLHACIGAGKEHTVQLGFDVMTTTVPVGFEWKDQEDITSFSRDLIDKMAQAPSDFDSLPVKSKENLANAYRNLLSALCALLEPGQEVPVMQFWARTLQNPTVYNIAMVDQLMMMPNTMSEWTVKDDDTSKMAWLNALQQCLENFKNSTVATDAQIVQSFGSAIEQAFTKCLEGEADTTRFAPEIANVLQICSKEPLENVDSKDKSSTNMTLYGRCLMVIIEVLTYHSNKSLVAKAVKDAVPFLVKTSVKGLPYSCQSKVECECVCSPLAFTTRNFILNEVACNQPQYLQNDLTGLMQLYKTHPIENVLEAVKSMYPLSKDILTREFDYIFGKITSEEFLSKHCFMSDILHFLAMQMPQLMKSNHVDALEEIVRRGEDESQQVFDVIAILAENNVGLLKGRGNDYYDLAKKIDGAGYDAVSSVTTIFRFIGCQDEKEAERVVALMEKQAVKDPSKVHRNELLEAWKKIALAYPNPVHKRDKLIKEWQKEPELKSNATEVLAVKESKTCTLL